MGEGRGERGEEGKRVDKGEIYGREERVEERKRVERR